MKRVLIAPLDWGLGHSTRCIPIIHALQNLEIEVIIAAEGAVASLLKNEFPNIRILPLKGYRIRYAKTSAGLFWKILTQIHKIIRTIREEHIWLEKIIQEENIDLVISDNRYGLHTQQIPCVFITHQLTIKAPFDFIELILQKINYHFINRFSRCWIPDAKGSNNLAGILSHPKVAPRIPVDYLGILNRMNTVEHQKFVYKYCFLLSGPEPQRTILENRIVAIIPELSGAIMLLRGLPNSNSSLETANNTTVLNHVSTAQLNTILSESECIICRSGYTSVMELIGLKKQALLIPTPGQTEQLYLANKLQNDQLFAMVQQNKLNIESIKKAKSFHTQHKEIPIFSTTVLEGILFQLMRLESAE